MLAISFGNGLSFNLLITTTLWEHRKSLEDLFLVVILFFPILCYVIIFFTVFPVSMQIVIMCRVKTQGAANSQNKAPSPSKHSFPFRFFLGKNLSKGNIVFYKGIFCCKFSLLFLTKQESSVCDRKLIF
jgi:hypothetical protein